MNKKKLIFVSHALAVGGAERHIVTLCNSLSQRGYQIKILLLDNPRVDFFVDSNIEIVFLGMQTPALNINGNKAVVTFYPCHDYYVNFLSKLKLKFLKQMTPSNYLVIFVLIQILLLLI